MFRRFSIFKINPLFVALLLLGLVIILFLKGCGGNSLTPIRVGTHRWPGYDVAFYAQEAGLFKKRGLDVELALFDVNQDEVRSLIQGNLDAAFIPLWDLMQVDPGENTPVYIMVTNISHGSDGLVARPGN